jgi:integrase
MRGNITRRGKSSWRIKFDVGADETGKRLIQYQTVHGSKKDAQAELAKRLTEFAEGRYVAPTVETVASYAEHWLEHIAPATRSPITVSRYRTLIVTHIIPGLGDKALQSLDGVRIDKFYAGLRTNGRWYGGGLSSMTLHHLHSVLSQILESAVKARKLARSPIADVQTKPKPKTKQIEVLNEIELATLLDHLRDKGHPLYLPVLLASATGLRRGEVLGLRWQDIDFAKETLQVAQAVEKIGGKLHIKAPKTARSRRTIKLPAALVPELTRHRKEQSELRLKLGLGKNSADLVFTTPLGAMMNPNYLSESFSFEVKAAGLKPVTFHGLRHTHITHLLKSGVPVHVVSARAGHSKPAVTLNTYSHLLGGEDDLAADSADETLKRVLGANPVPIHKSNP